MQLIRFFAIIILYGTTSICFADNANIGKQISELINDKVPRSNVGILVQNLSTNEIIYAHNENKLFTPASTTKLFTAIAGYLKLGKNFRYKTSMYISKKDFADLNTKNNNAKLVSNLYIKFTGDPELSKDRLYALIANLKKKSIKKVKGNIVIDDTIFVGSGFAEGWTWDSNEWFYSAPITAAMLDSNRISVNLSKPNKIGDILNANFTFSQPKKLSVRSKVRAVTIEDSKKKCRININASENNNYKLTGCWPIKSTASTLKLAIKNPRNYIRDVLLDAFRTAEIPFSGRIIFKRFANSKLAKVIEAKSSPYHKLAKEILVNSDNIYTESITKTLGNKVYSKGSFKCGLLAIKDILIDFAAIDFDTIKLVDGSGLSRYNLVSPIVFNKLLLASYTHKDIHDFLLSNLDWSKGKSFVKYRLEAFELKPDIRAKTGSLSGVSAITGYLKTNSNKNLVFSIIINGFNDKLEIIKNFEDEICKLLVNNV